MKILNREQLIDEYKTILTKGNLVKDGIDFKIENTDKTIITQSTSGSRNEPLTIPRSYNDVADIIYRFLSYYEIHFGCLPKKIAMLGGISHMKLTSSIQIKDTVIRFFNVDEIPEIVNWKPEIITCYPSILRELIARFSKNLKFIKAIKVGGEKLFPSDCEKIFEIAPHVLIIEQYGSTELPALALRAITQSNFQFDGFHITVPFELQEKRFSYLDIHQEGWHPFIAKDNFPELLFKIDTYYDTGDEALWVNSKPTDFRRRNDKENDYWLSINHLLKAGFTNLQLDLDKLIIISEDNVFVGKEYRINDTNFLVRYGKPKRILSSNKLPLVTKFYETKLNS